MKYVLSLFVLWCYLPTSAQNETMLHYANTITQKDLKQHLSILASDAYEGRETGMKGQKMAADYLADHFESNGLLGPVEEQDTLPYFQTFKVTTTDWTACSIKTPSKMLRAFKHFYPFQHFSMETREREVVFVGYGVETPTYSDYTNIDVKDKIVVMVKGQSPYIKEKLSDYYISTTAKVELAWEKGAAMVFFVHDSEEAFQNKNTVFKSYLFKPYLNYINQNIQPKTGLFFTSPESASALFGLGKNGFQNAVNKLKKTGKIPTLPTSKLTVSMEIDAGTISTENVMAYVEGTEKKEEVIIISAHYDHIGTKKGKVYNGADDNGSGTVALMEIAEAFALAAKEGHRPKRSVLFIAFTGEEKGLYGSNFYVKHPVFPLTTTVVNLNIEMIGRVDKAHEGNPDYTYIIGSDMRSADLHKLHLSTVKSHFPRMRLDYTYNSKYEAHQYYYRSDHYNFAKNNIPFIFYFSGTHPDYHKPTDTVDKINFEKVEHTAQLIFCTAWQVANRKDRVKE